MLTALLILGWLTAGFFTGCLAEKAWGEDFARGDTASMLFLFWPIYLLMAVGSIWATKKEAEIEAEDMK